MARKFTKTKITAETANFVLEARHKGLTIRQIARKTGRTVGGINSILYRLNKNPKLYDHINEPDPYLSGSREKQMEFKFAKRQKALPETVSAKDVLIRKMLTAMTKEQIVGLFLEE